MFCKNCGHELEVGAAFCANCGQPVEQTQNVTSFCMKCGKPIDPNASVCLNCGYAIPRPFYQEEQNQGRKSKIAAGLFGIFLGSLGVHNFYLGYKGKAFAQLLITLLTFGIGGVVTSIWGLIEGIMILTGSIDRDADGNPLGD